MVSYGGEQSLDRYLALSARGIPFNVAHAAGNFVIAFAAGPALVRMISRFRDRMRVHLAARSGTAGGRGDRARVRRWRSRRSPQPARAGAPAGARQYLERQQNSDGGLRRGARVAPRTST